jgi:hypothetical protein
MTTAEQLLWTELVSIVAEIERVLAVVARDVAWKEKHKVDYARFTFLAAKLAGLRAAISELRRREEEQR